MFGVRRRRPRRPALELLGAGGGEPVCRGRVHLDGIRLPRRTQSFQLACGDEPGRRHGSLRLSQAGLPLLGHGLAPEAVGVRVPRLELPEERRRKRGSRPHCFEHGRSRAIA